MKSQRLFWARGLLTLLALAFLVSACGRSDGPSGAGSPALIVPPADLKGATATGFVFQGSPVIIIDDPRNAPPGDVPVAGAHITIREKEGNVVASGETSSNGHFTINDLPSGFLTAEVRRDPNSAAPDLSLPFTAFPITTILLGKSYPISREKASEIALAEVPKEALVIGTLQPLPPDSLVYPMRHGAEAADPLESDAHEVLNDEWFFFVNLNPSARFAHPVKYMFVNAETGELTQIDPIFWPPVVNHVGLWTSGMDYILYQGIDVANFSPQNLPDEASAVPTVEVIQLPLPGDSNDASKRAAPKRMAYFSELFKHNTDPASIFVIILKGFDEIEFEADLLSMRDFFTLRGVPVANQTLLDLSKFTSNSEALSMYLGKLNAVNQVIQDRLNEGLHSTLVLYTTSHGAPGIFGVLPRDLEPTEWTSWRPEDLKLETTPACRVRVFLDFCNSGGFASKLDDIFLGLPSPERHDAVFYASSGVGQLSGYVPLWWSLLARPFVGPPGGDFTNAFLQHLRVANGDTVGLLDPDGKLIPPMENLRTNSDPQNPEAYIVPGDPVRCQVNPDDGGGIPPDTTPPEIIGVLLDREVITTDSDGAVVTFDTPGAVDNVDPNPTVTCGPPSGTRFSLGTTQVVCTATDGTGNTSSGGFKVRVILNTPPTADAGPDRDVSTGSLVTLNGNRSDPDNQKVTLYWTLAQKPAGSHVALLDPTAASIEFTPDVDGDYIFTLVANDGLSESSPDSVTITAYPPPPSSLEVTTASLPNGITKASYQAPLNATGGDGMLTWELAPGSNPLPPGLTLSHDGRLSGTPTTPGTYAFTVQVTDSGNVPRTHIRALSLIIDDYYEVHPPFSLPFFSPEALYNVGSFGLDMTKGPYVAVAHSKGAAIVDLQTGTVLEDPFNGPGVTDQIWWGVYESNEYVTNDVLAGFPYTLDCLMVFGQTGEMHGCWSPELPLPGSPPGVLPAGFYFIQIPPPGSTSSVTDAGVIRPDLVPPAFGGHPTQLQYHVNAATVSFTYQAGGPGTTAVSSYFQSPNWFNGTTSGRIVSADFKNNRVVTLTDGNPGQLWWGDPTIFSKGGQLVGNVGSSPRRVRCLLPICVVSNFGSADLTLIVWDGVTAPTIAGTVPGGDGSVGIDLKQVGSDIYVISTGFNNNTYTINRIAPDGTVVSTNSHPAPPGCTAPGHAIFVEDPPNSGQTSGALSCNGSSALAVIPRTLTP